MLKHFSHLNDLKMINSETMITIDDSLTEEEIVETLKAHKQIISNIKTQNWPMHRKLKVKSVYIKQLFS